MTQTQTQTQTSSRMEAFASSVRDCINTALNLGATVDFCPELRAADILSASVFVVPVSMESAKETRQDDCISVEVAVILASPASSSSEVSTLLATVDSIAQTLEADTLSGASLQRLESGPPSGEAWLEDGVFVGAISASWKWWCGHA